MLIVEILGYDEERFGPFSDPLMIWLSNAFTQHGAVKHSLGLDAGQPGTMGSAAGPPMPTSTDSVDPVADRPVRSATPTGDADELRSDRRVTPPTSF